MRFNIATGYDTPVLLPSENSQTFSPAFQQKMQPIKLFIYWSGVEESNLY